MKRFEHVALVGKPAPGIGPVIEQIRDCLRQQGLRVTLERRSAEAAGISGYPVGEPAELGRQCDLGVVVGGDGTMLGFAREVAPFGLPLVGINQGRLGFITDIPFEGFREALAPILAGDYATETRSMLEGEVLRDGQSIFGGVALNDVVVGRGATAAMIELRIHVGDEFVANLRADGVIMASPTGSTAYALSAGGPLLHPSIEGWLLVPIASHALSNRPIVLPDRGEVSLEIVGGRDASVNFDMQSLTQAQIGDRICVRRSAHQAKFLHASGWSYYATLRKSSVGTKAMLKRLTLRDFVIVPTLELDWQPGFCALTGETGAGKSILLDALQLLLGGRGDAGVVREGAARAELSAEFDCPKALLPWLEEAGFEASDSLLLRRVIDAQGKSRAWVNGSAATVAQLAQAGEFLVDIHGQHAWQKLTRPASVRALLDDYAEVDGAALAATHTQWRAAVQRLAEAKEAQATLTRERERLQWQLEEIGRLAPGADEWPELNTEHQRLSNAQALIDAARGGLEAVSEGEETALSRLTAAEQALREVVGFDPALQAALDAVSGAMAQAEDAAHTLRSYLHRAEPDPERLGELDERLSSWMQLARRYRQQPADLPALQQSWQAELAELDARSDLEALEAAVGAARKAFDTEAAKATKLRAKAAPKLAGAVSAAMQELGMAGGRLELQLTKQDEPQSFGAESAELLVAGHAGATPRPLAKVASGGELSRLALAIAVCTAQADRHGAPTLVFDEIDSGVGGAVAHTVGRLMKQLGSQRQVLAVTHLAQVAACADQHWVVAKQAGKAGVASNVSPVAGEARVKELARMLGGSPSDASVAHAKELLGAAA